MRGILTVMIPSCDEKRASRTCWIDVDASYTQLGRGFVVSNKVELDDQFNKSFDVEDIFAPPQ